MLAFEPCAETSSHIPADAEPFDKYMYSLQQQPKSYIKQGPQTISKEIQRTASSLLLVDLDPDAISTISTASSSTLSKQDKPMISSSAPCPPRTLMRASKDFYPFATNFSDLPDLVTSQDHAEGTNQKSFFKKLDKLNEIAQSMVYDEEVQAHLMMRKQVTPFKGTLTHFNNQGVGSKGNSAKGLKLNLPMPDKLLKSKTGHRKEDSA